MYVRALSPASTPTTLRLKKKDEAPEDPYAKAKAGPNYQLMARRSICWVD